MVTDGLVHNIDKNVMDRGPRPHISQLSHGYRAAGWPICHLELRRVDSRWGADTEADRYLREWK